VTGQGGAAAIGLVDDRATGFGSRSRSPADPERLQKSEKVTAGIAQRAGGVVDLVQDGGSLSGKDGALRRRGRIPSGKTVSADFSKDVVDALDRELGAFPAERSATQAGEDAQGFIRAISLSEAGTMQRRRPTPRLRCWYSSVE